jgi:IMP-specific 5'-nucleotidase
LQVPLSSLAPFLLVSRLTCRFQHSYNSTEWIKGLLAVPFVIHSQPTGVFETRNGTVAQMAEEAHRRYAEIMKDVEDMIDDHSISVSIPQLGSTHDQFSCPPKSRTPRTIQTQVAGTNCRDLLHPSSSWQLIQVPGQQTLNLIKALCSSVLQRHPTHSKHGPAHGVDLCRASGACHV